MTIFLIKALQLILCLSLLIVLHEGGHFLIAKLCKVRVEKFCLFFDPYFTLFKWHPRGSETEYCIGWLPLGGYVKISGMIDESMDTEQMKLPPQPWEFRTHPAWQRLLIMIGGVLVNFIVALVIYSMILFHWGETYVPLSAMTEGMQFNTEAKALGFEDHDILLGADDETFTSFNSNESVSSVYRSISNAGTVRVLRDGKEVEIRMPEGGLNLLDMFRSVPPFVTAYIPFNIDSIVPGLPAAEAGIEAGDNILSISDTPIATWTDLQCYIYNLSESLEGATTADSLRKRTADVVVSRAQTAALDTLTLTFTPDLLLGVYGRTTSSYYTPVHHTYSFLESFPAGISYGWHTLAGYVNDLKYLFTSDGVKSIGSFGAIGSMFPKAWDWKRFWELTAFISLILAFMNILPIPALDGGHVLFLLYEIITRRKPGDKFLERAQMVGMFILLALMVYAIGNDIVRFLFH